MTWWGKQEIGLLMTQWNINLGAFDDAMGKLETLAMMKLGPWWSDGEIGGPRPLILFKRFNTAPLHLSNFLTLNFNWEIRCLASWKRIHGALILHCSSSKIVWWLPMFDFGIFCHLLTLMGIYQVVSQSGYLKSFIFSFLSSPFFFLFFIFFFISLSGAPLAPQPLDIVHPCHPVATQLLS